MFFVYKNKKEWLSLMVIITDRNSFSSIQGACIDTTTLMEQKTPVMKSMHVGATCLGVLASQSRSLWLQA